MGAVNTKLWEAVEDNDLPALYQVLEHKEVDVNHFKEFPHTSSTNKLLDMKLSVNLKHLKHVDKDWYTPLHWAAKQGQREMVKLLLVHGAIKNQKALHERYGINEINEPSSEAGKCPAMQTLAEGGEHKHYYLKYEQYTPLYYACKRGHPELVLDILFHHTGRPFPEMETLLYEQRDRVAQLLIEHKADFRLCLCQAARQGEYPVASLLLMMGADPNGAPAETVERIVIERRPPLEDIRVPPVALRHRPLMQACWGGHVHIVKLLLQYYAKVTDDEINAAFDGDHREIATLLLEAKDQQRGGTSVLDDEHSANYVQPQRSRPQQQVQQATLSTSQTNTASYPVLNTGATPAQYHQDYTPSYHETNRQQQTQQPSPRGPRRDSNASSSLSVEEYSTYPPATSSSASASASASYAPPPPEHAQYLEDGNLIGSTGHGNDLNSIQVQVDTNSDPHQHHNQPQLGELLDETYAAGENSYTPSSLHIPLQPEPLYQQHQGGASSMHSPQQPPRALTPSPRAHSPLYPSHVRGQQPQQQLQSHLHTPLQPLRERAQSQDRMTLSSSSSSSNFNNNSQHLNHRPSLQEEQLSDHHSPGDSRSSLATADFDASSSIFEHRRSRSDEPSFIRTAESSQPVNNTPYEQQHRTLEQQPQQQQQQQYQIYPHFDPYQQPQQTSASSSLPYQPQAPSYPHQYQQRQQQTSPPPYPGMGSGDASSSSSSQAMLRQYQQHQQAYNHPSSPLRPTPSQSSGLAPQLEFLSLEGQTGHSPPASPSHSPSQQQQPLQHRPSQQLVGLSPMRVPPSPASPPSPMPVHHPHHPYGPPPMNAAYDVQAQALKAHAQAQAAQVQAQIQARAAHHVQMQQQQQEQQRQQQQQAQVARIQQQQASPQPALDYYGGGGGLGLVEIGALAAAMAKEARQDSAESKERAQVTTEDGYELDFDELEISREIARGSFGIVYFGKFRGTEVAIKKLLNQKLTKKELDEFSSEINVMKKLHHPNVLLLMGVCRIPPNLCMVTELMTGSLWDLLHKSKGRHVQISLKMAMGFILDTAKGMNYLHLFRPPVLHRDLKTPNLLVDSHFNVKIADFGLARLKSHMMTGNLGTCQYMAPEVIKSESYSESADVYSFGIVMWEILTRRPPFHGMQTMQIAYGVVHSGLRPPIPPSCPPPLACLMQECWHQDPNRRPSFSHILDRLKAIPI